MLKNIQSCFCCATYGHNFSCCFFQKKMDLELGPLLENDLDDNWIKENSTRELSISCCQLKTGGIFLI